MHAVQTQFWAVRDYLSPVLRESKFKEHGRITPEEFVAAGDFLTYKFPVWTWEKGDGTRVRDFLPKDKQYLMTRNVPCLRRATTLEYTNEQEDAEKLLNFSEGPGDKEDEWVQTHAGRVEGEAGAVADIEDIPDLDGPSQTTSSITTGLNKMSLDERGALDAQPIPSADEIPDIDDIPDMEDEGMEEPEDAAAAAPETTAAADATPIEVAKGNLLQVRTYDVMITYDKYYQTPRIWLLGYDESGNPLTPSQVFQDVSAEHAYKTVTIEPFPHSTTLTATSVHPCKHASVMKKVIDRMNAGITEEQKRMGLAAKEKDSKSGKKWLGGMVRKVTGGSGGESPSSGAETPASDDADGMRVDFYLVVFLKFIASIVPTIEVDSTTAF